MPACVPGPAGLVAALLREIAGLLAALLHDSSGETAIDLRSLPMSSSEREQLGAFLGRGEIDADCDVAGITSVRETRYAGVWWVVHRAADGSALVEQIVVARVPGLLLAHPADIDAARQNLGRRLDGSGVAVETSNLPLENPTWR